MQFGSAVCVSKRRREETQHKLQMLRYPAAPGFYENMRDCQVNIEWKKSTDPTDKVMLLEDGSITYDSVTVAPRLGVIHNCDLGFDETHSVRLRSLSLAYDIRDSMIRLFKFHVPALDALQKDINLAMTECGTFRLYEDLVIIEVTKLVACEVNKIVVCDDRRSIPEGLLFPHHDERGKHFKFVELCDAEAMRTKIIEHTKQ